MTRSKLRRGAVRPHRSSFLINASAASNVIITVWTPRPLTPTTKKVYPAGDSRDSGGRGFMAFGRGLEQIWAVRRQQARRVVSDGRVEIKKVGRRIHVTCVHRDAFSHGARELCGSWKDKSQCWSFSVTAKRLVIELCERVYGEEAIQLVGFPPDRM